MTVSLNQFQILATHKSKQATSLRSSCVLSRQLFQSTQEGLKTASPTNSLRKDYPANKPHQRAALLAAKLELTCSSAHFFQLDTVGKPSSVRMKWRRSDVDCITFFIRTSPHPFAHFHFFAILCRLI